MLTKLREVYGLDVADMPNGNRLRSSNGCTNTRLAVKSGVAHPIIAYEIEGR